MINIEKAKGFVSGAIVMALLSSTVYAVSLERKITAVYDNIKIYVDGELLELKNGNGNKVEPFISEGTTYLPVRAISQALGKTVEWNPDSKEIYLGKKPSTEIKEVTVSNVEEFFASLGSNKHIKLKEGVYNLSKLAQGYSESKNVFWRKEFDGNELVLNNLNNLTIEGTGSKPVEIVVEPRYADVLTFVDCDNVNISNIKAGHTIEKGYCTGGVLDLSTSKNIKISNSVFYGCGTYGLMSKNVENLKFENSIIEECTYGILQISESKNFNFLNSKFRNCREFDMIGIRSSKNIVFNGCEITNNQTTSDFSEFMEISLSSDVKFLNSIFESNTAKKFLSSDSKIDFTGTTFTGNSFDEKNKNSN